MSAKPRDLFKTRAQRIGEVYHAIGLKSGAFDVQLVAFGGALSFSTTTLSVAAGEGVVNGQIFQWTAKSSVALTGAGTSAGQYRKVLVQIDKTDTLSLKNGEISSSSQAAAVKPGVDANKLELGWIELPASFTVGSTNLSADYLKKTPYWAD